MSRRTLGVVAVVVLVGVGCLAASSGGKSGVPCAEEFAAYADAQTIRHTRAVLDREDELDELPEWIQGYVSATGKLARACWEAQSGAAES